MNLKTILGLTAVSVCLAMPLSSPADTGADNRWDFDVYLDDKKIGKHVYALTEVGGEQQISSKADFNYRILFIPAYRYKHRNVELWNDNCLTRFEASTNANGKQIEVSGESNGVAFRVDDGSEPRELPNCVMSFAYWNPDFLAQRQLLNPQTGEYVDVKVENVGTDVLEVRGRQVAAQRFRLTAYEVDLTLWYSSDNEWLALESIAKGGRIIRYELV